MRQATERDRRVGRVIFVRGYGAVKGLAKIKEVYHGIPGGVKLDRPFGIFRSWNIDELLVRNAPN